MRVEKTELARKIDKLKSVVPKNSNIAVLQGICVCGDKMIASNGEMTVKAKLGALEGESFIIPAKAFDLIKSLPEGELTITENQKNIITIRTGTIKNYYQSLPAESYPYSAEHTPEIGCRTQISSAALKEAMAHVLYAIPQKNTNQIMTALCLEAKDGKLNYVGLDGHVLAWDQQDFEGEFTMLLPRGAVEKLLALEMGGSIAIEYSGSCAIFRSEEYEVYTRLIEGKYYPYANMFNSSSMETRVKRQDLLEAITRAKLCTDEKTPTKFEIEGDSLKLSIKDNTADYSEIVRLHNSMEKLVIGFNSGLVLETLKAFDKDDITLRFGGSNVPMIVEAGSMRAVVLPVKIRT